MKRAAFATAALLGISLLIAPQSATAAPGLGRPPTPSASWPRPAGVKLAKQAPPAQHPVSSINTFWYGQGSETINTTGSSVNLMVATPPIDTPTPNHSLFEVALSKYGQSQIIEAGWTVDQGLNGDMDPHLFVFWWRQAAGGARIGQCYNGCGWVANPGAAYVVGQNLAALNGTLPRFTWQYTAGNWWLGFATTAGSWWLGYYPETLWTTGAAPLAADFNSTQYNQYFGEVASGTSTTPCSNMGTGALPTATSSAGQSRISSVSYIGNPAVANLTVTATAPTKYNAVMITGTTRSFNVSGPGYC